jgi:hypothetical protein
MAIIPQINLFDFEEIEKLGDLERFKLTLEGIDDEQLMRKLEKERGNGRDDYPVRVMWNLFIAMKVFGHQTVESFRRELSRNSQLRKICGLNDYEYAHGKRKHLVPPSRVFTGFITTLVTYADEIEQIFSEQVNKLFELLPGFGETLAGDGKYLDSYARREQKEAQTNTDNRTENDAKWSTKENHYKDSKGKTQTKKEYHFGFKAHIICDVKTELPVAFSVTAANADEKKEMIKLLENPLLSGEERRNTVNHLLLDRGYDSTEMIKTIKSKGIAPVIDIRNSWKNGEETKQYKDTDIVYNFKGDIFYVVLDKDSDNGTKNVKMKYEGYDMQKKCLRYSHEGKIYKIYISYDERVFLPIARDSAKFGKLYDGRTSIERLNGRLDRDYMFEDHTIRGLNKMRLMLSLSMVIMNGTAIGKIKNGRVGLRSLKTAA